MLTSCGNKEQLSGNAWQAPHVPRDQGGQGRASPWTLGGPFVLGQRGGARCPRARQFLPAEGSARSVPGLEAQLAPLCVLGTPIVSQVPAWKAGLMINHIPEVGGEVHMN